MKTMITRCLLTLCGFFFAQALYADGLTISDFLMKPGGTKTVTIDLANSTSVCGFQADVVLPEGITCSEATLNTTRIPSSYASSYKLSTRTVGNTVKLVCTCTSTMRAAAFTGTTGAVVNLTLTASSSMSLGTTKTIAVNNQILAGTDLTELTPSNSSATVSIAHYDAYIGGIYYNLNPTTKEATVTYKDATKQKSYSGSTTIPEKVAFGGIEYSVTSIGDYAFEYCPGLTSITIPNSVTSIGNSAFQSCLNLTEINIPNSVTSIGSSAFYDSGITSIVIPGNVTRIEMGTFEFCPNLTSVDLPNSVTYIGSGAFRQCPLTSITLPEALTSIDQEAFAETNLTSIFISKSLTNISNTAFLYAKHNQTCIVVDERNSKYDSRDNCNAIIETSTNKLIFGCNNTIIPSTITEIGNEAFMDCQYLTSLTIPNSVTSIGRGAFGGCVKLTSITIPNSVSSIGEIAFTFCPALQDVYCEAETVPTTASSAFYSSDITLHVPASALEAYKSTAPWSEFGTIVAIPVPVSSISVTASSNEITVGETLTLTATVSPEDATDKTVTWSSSDSDIVSVNAETGEITGVAVGSATVTATATDGSDVAGSIEITVKEEPADDPSTGEDTDLTQLDNVVYIEPFEALSGTTTTLSVKMKNSANIQGYQFDLHLPEGVTVATDEDGFALAELSTVRTTKAKTDYFGSDFQNDGAFRVLCGSTKGYTFSGNDGEICQIKLNVAEGMEEGEYPVVLKAITTTSNEEEGFDTPYFKATLTVKSYNLGDVNNDGSVNITDFTATANHILGHGMRTFIKKAADFNNDNLINVTDLMALANYILRGNVAKAPAKSMVPKKAATKEDNYIYVEPQTVTRGGQATISIKMKNTESIQGYQFDMYLPEGMSFAKDNDGFYLAEMSTERTTTQKTDYFGSDIQSDGALRFLCGSTKGYTFSGNDGEIARVTINVSDDAELGTLPLVLKALTVTNNVEIGFDTPSYETTITVVSGEVEYAEGYSLQVVPFESSASQAHELTLNFCQPDENIEEMEFEVIAPKCMARTKSGRASKAPVFCNDDRIFEEDHSISMTATADGFKVTVKAITDDEYRVIAGTEGSLIKLYYSGTATAEEGLYEFQIKNIKMTTSDGDIIDVVPYTASVLMGSPELEGNVKLYGNYSSSDAMNLAKKVAANVGVTSIDMSAITAINKRTSIPTGNANAMVYMPEGMTIANKQNVVSGGACANLVLTDGHDFSAPKAFTAASASYKRNVSKEWGTIMLPYAVSSTADVQYYALSDVDLENGVLTFDEATTIEANTPAIYKASGSVVDASASSVDVPVCGGIVSGAAVGGLTLAGTYEKTTLTGLDPEAESGIYYIKDNKFWRGNISVTIPAFRAYFEAAQAGNKVLSIGGMPTGIEAIGIDADSRIYTIDGKMANKDMKSLPTGMYIQNNKKIIIKK